jgi:hypothetical protein
MRHIQNEAGRRGKSMTAIADMTAQDLREERVEDDIRIGIEKVTSLLETEVEAGRRTLEVHRIAMLYSRDFQ